MSWSTLTQNEIKRLEERIAQLEKLLCPNGHDFHPINHIPIVDISFSPNRQKEVAKIRFEECLICKKRKRISIKEESI